MSIYIINENGVDRPMTASEVANLELVRAENVANETAEAEQKAAKLSIIAKLGLTSEEASILFGGNYAD